MKVSVIIPAYNYAGYLRQCIRSVFEQTYSDLECIVVNDGSTDDTVGVLEEIKKEFPGLVIVNKENGGLSSARNAGIRYSSGDLIAFLDADDLWKPTKLQNQLATFDKTDADIVFSDYIFLEGDQYSAHTEKIITDLKLSDFVLKNPVIGSSSSIILKRKVIDTIGFFDNDLRSLEDMDYWFRCSHAGFKFSFCDSKDVVLRNHSSGINMGRNYLKMFSHHLIVLDKQMNTLLQGAKRVEDSDMKHAIRGRLSLMRWYTTQLKRRDYTLLTYLMGIRLTGFNYLFHKIELIGLFKTLFRF